MITSSQVIKLFEDWFNSAKVFGHPVDIYVNPHSSDFKELVKSIKDQRKDIRWVVNLRPPSKIYVANALLLTHEDMLKVINRQSSDRIILGYGQIVNNKIDFYKYPGAIIRLGGNGKSDWISVEKYIPGLRDWLK